MFFTLQIFQVWGVAAGSRGFPLCSGSVWPRLIATEGVK